MDWVPIAFETFKVTALLVAMFFAIKWRYDEGEKQGRQAALRASAKVAVAFVVALVAVGFVAYYISTKLGLNLSY
ncbi:MAG: hypothetical protein CMO04_04305 [Thalassospira sp.]|nr:hypothetical protein [Thalassospira sp.]MAL39096.1 hypothetical protein [Thalassospira sp.]HAY49653.1 hypothetical protein [Thalassospira sp.]